MLPTGLDVAHFASGNGAGVRARYRIAPDETVLLFVGRIAQEKNLGFLLRALSPLLKRPKMRLMLVGGGPSVDAYRELAGRLGILDRVILTGFVEPAHLPDFYAAGDLFTFSSRTETQGLCIAEALAAGLPCVVVNSMGAPEAVEHEQTGLIVPPDEKRFREAVTHLIENPELRRQMAARARAGAGQFSRARRVDELLALYEEMIEDAARWAETPLDIV